MDEVIFATIDIGTNTVLLLIAKWGVGAIHESPLQVIRDEARITRLGERLHQQPLFLPAAQKRTLAALQEYKGDCDAAGVSRIAAVGTAAFRKAQNAQEFVKQIKKETDIEIEIISGDEEARLSYLSVEQDFGRTHQNLVALDIGGGSTEIISEKGGMSLDLGAVTLTERYLKHDPPREEEVRAMVEEIEASPLSLLRRGDGGKVALVGLAGTVTTLSAIKQKLVIWDGAKVQGSVLAMTDLDEMLKLFQKTTIEEKKRLPGMVPGREDTILAGTLILIKVMERLGTDRAIVSDRGLRYGLFYERFSGLSD